MLDRYRKPGGFKMLVQVVETSGSAKQEKILELLRIEDAAWADALKNRILSVARIYTWNDETITDLIAALPDLTLATAMQGAPDDFRARVDGLMNSGRRRKINDLMKERSPNSSEISTNHVKILNVVRQLLADGQLRFEKFDPSLQIEDNIEELLSRTAHAASANPLHPTPNTTTTSAETSAAKSTVNQSAAGSDFTIQFESVAEEEEPRSSSPARTQAADSHAQLDIIALKRKLIELHKENTALKSELSSIKKKLSQIKKIA